MSQNRAKTKIGMIGGGWRAEFFLRIAQEASEEFEFTGIFLRSEAKAAALKETFGVPTLTSLEEFLKLPMDYAILCIPREHTLDYLEPLYRHGIPVLCETPPSSSLENLTRVWELTQRLGGKIQVAEQYFLQPYHSAALRVIGDGLLGEVSNIRLSMMHGYHAISVIRKALGVGFTPCTITSRHYTVPVVRNCNRAGMCTQKQVVDSDREIATFEFENGQVGFYDFDGEQYFSYIRHRSMCVQGVMGELFDETVRYTTPDMVPVQLPLSRVDTGANSNLEGYSHRGIMLGERFVYRNPFEGCRLTDDEIAIASCMRYMKDYADGKGDFYPLADALQDAYFTLLMGESQGNPVQSQKQPWCK